MKNIGSGSATTVKDRKDTSGAQTGSMKSAQKGQKGTGHHPQDMCESMDDFNQCPEIGGDY